MLLFSPIFEKVTEQGTTRGQGLAALRAAVDLANPDPCPRARRRHREERPACLQAGAVGIAAIRLFLGDAWRTLLEVLRPQSCDYRPDPSSNDEMSSSLKEERHPAPAACPPSSTPASSAAASATSPALSPDAAGEPGSSFGKIAFSRLGVGHYVLYRFIFACIGMLPIVETPRFSRREWTLLLIGAFLGIPVQFIDPV
jgi:hypothetical protein